MFSQTKEDMLRWIARCLLLHGVAPCELMDEAERSLHINILFDLPWQADLAAIVSPSSPAVLSGGTSLGKLDFSCYDYVLKGANSPIRSLLGMSCIREGSPQSSMACLVSLNS
jgi:hypothetical protein